MGLQSICLRRVAYLLFGLSTFAFLPYATAKRVDYSVDDDGSVRRKNDLSRERILDIRDALLGREVVLRLNWRGNQVIHNGLVVHYSETTHTGRQQRAKNPYDYGMLESPAGDTATIAGMNFLHDHDVNVLLKTTRGTRTILTVRAPNKTKNNFVKLSDKWLTSAWLEDQLSNQAVRFLPKQKGIDRRAIQFQAKAPSEGLSLTMPLPAVHEPQPSAPSEFPTYLDSLRISASPAKPRRGDSVLLNLEYDIAGRDANAISVLETRTLSFNGKPLPGYPLAKRFNRASGPSESSYRQAIPFSAKAGRYQFKGEVCVNGECISRIVTVTVE